MLNILLILENQVYRLYEVEDTNRQLFIHLIYENQESFSILSCHKNQVF